MSCDLKKKKNNETLVKGQVLLFIIGRLIPASLVYSVHFLLSKMHWFATFPSR